ncbi:aminodeoxychorismate lyase [Permianibacter sp. IMCC34836]|uniref:aminodeoxychorismate lyase n=1 Tax=Permianibacter fluminis TaxID=2738515 RepID=UPI001552479C|nr:aminodeoxychorismate lyase [Permianibacter fluminis]NQD38908.1 aminodeoxychorismate lyase [Permianibacter fluminis]
MTDSWLDGIPCDRIAVDDRALLFGDSCFTTIAVRDGQPELWPRHRERLQQSLLRLQFPVLDLNLLTQEVMAACAGVERAILRVTLTRGAGGRGYALPVAGNVRRLLLRRDWPADIDQRGRDGVQLRWCETQLSEQPLLAGLKHGNRLEQVLARAEWQDARIAEGLMCDRNGHVIEGTTSNLFFCNADGHWCTPALDRCGVAGVMRAELLARFQAQGINVAQGDYSMADVQTATEVFICNSIIGLWPVLALADRRWVIGEQTRRLQQAIGRSVSP